MDDATTPKPTTAPSPTPTKSIDGMTPGTKAPVAPAPEAPKPATPIDISKLDGDGIEADPVVSKTDTDGTASVSVVSDSSAEIPEPSEKIEAPAKEEGTMPDMNEDAPKPTIKFDAAAAEAAMAEEDKNPDTETPASLSADGPKITNSMVPDKPKNKGKGLAIFVAVIIALGLIGGASFAFWKNNQSKKPKTNTTSSTSTTPNVSDKVNTATEDIDTELKKIDDTKEFQPSDISDSALGL